MKKYLCYLLGFLLLLFSLGQPSSAMAEDYLTVQLIRLFRMKGAT